MAPAALGDAPNLISAVRHADPCARILADLRAGAGALNLVTEEAFLPTGLTVALPNHQRDRAPITRAVQVA